MADQIARYDADKAMTCIGCNEQMDLAIVNRQLHRTRTLLFCTKCAPTFWSDRNWKVVVQNGLIRQMIKCIGCDNRGLKACINTSIDNVIVFCFHCRGKLVQQHQWDECRRGRRDLDLPGYAPKVLDTGIGSEQKRGH